MERSRYFCRRSVDLYHQDHFNVRVCCDVCVKCVWSAGVCVCVRASVRLCGVCFDGHAMEHQDHFIARAM